MVYSKQKRHEFSSVLSLTNNKNVTSLDEPAAQTRCPLFCEAGFWDTALPIHLCTSPGRCCALRAPVAEAKGPHGLSGLPPRLQGLQTSSRRSSLSHCLRAPSEAAKLACLLGRGSLLPTRRARSSSHHVQAEVAGYEARVS